MGFLEGFILLETNPDRISKQVDGWKMKIHGFLESGRWFFHGFCWNMTPCWWLHPGKWTAGNSGMEVDGSDDFPLHMGDFKMNHVNFPGCRRYSFNWLFILSIVMLLLRGCSLIFWTCFLLLLIAWKLSNSRNYTSNFLRSKIPGCCYW